MLILGLVHFNPFFFAFFWGDSLKFKLVFKKSNQTNSEQHTNK